MKVKLLLILLMFCLTSFLTAFQFKPISMDFSPQGSGSIKSFRSINNTENTIALQVRIYHRSMSSTGEDLLEEADSEFSIFPARMVLEPGKEQVIQVQYKGGSLEDREKAYRIIVEQVPVDFSEDSQTGLKILFRYIGSLYIVPESPRSDVVFSRFERRSSPDGDRFVGIIENRGSGHTILKNLRIELRSQEKTMILDSEELEGLKDSNILAGSKRELNIPWPEGYSLENMEGGIFYEELR